MLNNPFKLNVSPEELKVLLKEWAKVKEKEIKEETLQLTKGCKELKEVNISEAEKIFLK